MAILINRTFETVTPESAEDGEVAERGFICENEPYSFRELVDFLRGQHPSSWPATGAPHEWATSDPDEDFSSGESTTESVHYSRDNKPRAAKYWRKAFVAAGLVGGAA